MDLLHRTPKVGITQQTVDIPLSLSDGDKT